MNYFNCTVDTAPLTKSCI